MSTQHPDSGAQPAVKFAKSAVKQIENGFSITTDLPPCCLEFCPDAPDFFVVGCYKLVEDDPPSKTETEDDSKSEDKVEKEMEAMSIEDRNFLAEEPEQDGGKDISNSLEVEEAFDAASIKRKDFAEQPKPASTKSPQKRVGCLYLYKLYCVDSQTKSKEEQKILFSSAILDFSFSNLTPKLLAVATSTGRLHLYRLNAFDGQLVFLYTISVMKSDTLILSMNWIFPSTTSLGDRDCKRDILATSDSEGDIVLHYFSTPEYKYQNLSRLPKTSKHSDQAWCVAWTVDTKNFDRPILLSGGDDFQLLKHEFLRCIQQNGTPFVKLLSTEADCKTHMAGVTAIMPFPFYATEERLLVLTGSYDDHVRVYNVGDKKRRVLCELNLGGGVWKLRILRDIAKEQMILAKKDIIGFEKEAENRRKSELASEYAKVHPLACRRSQVPEPPPDPTVPLHFLVIASCMYAGVRILDIQRDGQKNWSIEVVGKFEEGKSMAYAASASPLTDGDGQRYKGRVMCASTSFYDEKGFVWIWK